MNALKRAALSLSLPLLAISSVAMAEPAPVVMIDSGPIRGAIAHGYARFLGIPYAAPPIGEARWQSPRPPVAWTTEREATRFGNTCPQKRQFGVFSRASTTEDCLYLNVFAAPGAQLRPVLFWIHGGGLVGGESDDYDPSRLVIDGDLVVVTFNYRLGRLGYLPRISSTGEGAVTANFGLLDQQFALDWVRRNIRTFGGDPDRVTIAGESAGAESVYALLAAPGAAGLFHGAIAQSGGYTPRVPSVADAASKGHAFATAAGCPDQSLTCLRSRTVDQILAAQNDFEVALLVDGTTLPLSFDTAFERGTFNRVPVLSGINKDESLWFIATDGTPALRNAADYAAALGRQYGSAAGAVRAEYPVSDDSDLMEVFGATQTDAYFACPQRIFDDAIARWTPLYHYEFADRTAPNYLPDVGFNLGAAHTFELGYLFPGFRGATGKQPSLNAAQARLSKAMVRYWSRFAATGDPNGPGSALPAWPRYAAKDPATLSLRLRNPIVRRDVGSRHHCAFWRALGPLVSL
jgi:para-nitrobenzyl esterase